MTEMVPNSMQTVANLANACAQQTSRRQTPLAAADPCYELFRRALARPPDEAAWQALLTQYKRLVWSWLGEYADDDACHEVFVRFWKAQHGTETPLAARFAATSAIMQYLKQCAFSVRIEVAREAARQRLLEVTLRRAALAELVWLSPHAEHTAPSDADLEQLIHAYLKTPEERALFDLHYGYGLPPREIQARRPDLFPTIHAVYRTQENLLKRLRRDKGLRQIWAGQSAVPYGGNPPVSPFNEVKAR